jgi:hypothetical protein
VLALLHYGKVGGDKRVKTAASVAAISVTFFAFERVFVEKVLSPATCFESACLRIDDASARRLWWRRWPLRLSETRSRF